jgi:uncharacterized protein YutE (UPF0331/DUF86 family)
VHPRARDAGATELVETDVRERRFAEHTLQIAIQAALDAASHIVSDERLGEPGTNRELFDLLVAAGWLERDLGERLRRMVGLRNILVHGYTAVDPAIVAEAASASEVSHGIGDRVRRPTSARRTPA